MSYILDALNKSEKERASKHVPGILSLRDDQPQSGISARQIAVVLLLLVFVNSLAVYYFFGPGTTTEPTQPQTSTTVVESQQPVSGASEVFPANQNQPDPIPRDKVWPDPVPFGLLPRSLQLQAPTVEITAHIYASDPQLRMVKIDGVARYEGDQLALNHWLVGITETGIILGISNRTYFLDVVEDWQL